METVDVLEAILGERTWQVRSDGRLCSIYWPAKWEPGINHARCLPEASLRTDDHEAPQANCTCGIYAHTDMNERELAFLDRPNVVLGTIAAWGRIEYEACGFRAQSARLLALGRSRRRDASERRAAIRYGVPLLPMSELASYSRARTCPLRAERQSLGALILVIDCGEAAAAEIAEIRAGLHRFIDRLADRRIDMVVCGEGASVVPLDGENRDRRRQLHAAIQMLVPDTGAPALARGLERARGRVLWAHRRWSVDVVMVSPSAPSRETRDQLQRARRDGVRVVCLCPSPEEGWDRRHGEHLPVEPGTAAGFTEALRDLAGKLELRPDQWPASWTRRQVAYPGSPDLRAVDAG